MTNLLRKQRIKPARPTAPADSLTISTYLERSVPEKHKLATQRALLGQIPRSTAIRVKCLQCCNYERETVRTCAVLTCALYPVRPYQDRAPGAPVDSDEEADGDDNQED
jgi:hypothetical protein